MPVKRSAKSPSIIDVAVGRSVRIWRLAKGMSQAQLASRIGVSFQQVQKYEFGSNRIGSGRLVRIAKALGVPVRTLFDGVETAPQSQAPSTLRLLADARAFRLARAFAVIGDATARLSIVVLVEQLATAIAHRRRDKQPGRRHERS
jgi:transcriptional regulator with XRE-family HTH domain